MLVKRDDTATWLGFESAREIMLFSVAIGTIVDVPNEIVNAKIQEVANKVEYDETELVLEGIDAASAKEFARDSVQKVASGNQDRNSEQ